MYIKQNLYSISVGPKLKARDNSATPIRKLMAHVLRHDLSCHPIFLCERYTDIVHTFFFFFKNETMSKDTKTDLFNMHEAY